MSGVGFTCVTGEVAGITTAKTIIGLAAAANHRVHIKAIKLGFKGTAVANEPVTVEYIRFTSNGTGTDGTALKRDADASETLEASFKHTYTVEPTGVTVLESFPLHPQGVWGEYLPIEAPIPVSGGDFWGIRITADDSVTGMATIVCDE
jgi:hypothetical protein